ncbi:MAG: glycerol-3-phosphate 1-O-acyltransferase PlsY [Betaproteobacteria bacterium AqS2]|uniref:Glycerol-3-phosphate acyltransferase n=1 Tax=Candidatus Amphirhobacter heronislandensis TaxID=1732024 RepID=A0A930UER1_9GAMM|nr:glycerol-3-phosphate 1-O-acyltransferase PlsY [Betaproteobacteria bacterium AqS2]
MELLLAAAAGFACGMLPNAVLVAKLFRLPDPRGYGSGNPGATNVMRSGNRLAGRLVFVLDCAKGLLPALACGWLLAAEGAASLAALGAVAGHVWSPLLRFKGGRGVATGLGGFYAIDWRLGLFATAMWLLVYLMTRIASLASVAAVVATMLLASWLHPFGSYPAVAVAGMAMIITIRHRQNLKKLAEGTEHSFKK